MLAAAKVRPHRAVTPAPSATASPAPPGRAATAPAREHSDRESPLLNRAGTVLSEEHDCYGNWSEHTQLHGSYSALTQEPHQNTQFSALQLPT